MGPTKRESRKIIDSKVPNGRGYVRFRKGIFDDSHKRDTYHMMYLFLLDPSVLTKRISPNITMMMMMMMMLLLLLMMHFLFEIWTHPKLTLQVEINGTFSLPISTGGWFWTLVARISSASTDLKENGGHEKRSVFPLDQKTPEVGGAPKMPEKSSVSSI